MGRSDSESEGKRLTWFDMGDVSHGFAATQTFVVGRFEGVDVGCGFLDAPWRR